ncbi:MAG: glycoside hydrolase family 127 protein, partial [Sphingomonadales bacterium]
GNIDIRIEPETSARFALSLRIPAWAHGAKLAINGEAQDVTTKDGYVRIVREWNKGDAIALDLPLEPRTLRAHPAVRHDAGRVAVMRGPLVYCLEGTDNGAGLNSILLQRGLGQAQTATIPNLRGAIAIDIPVLRETAANWGDALYSDKAPETEAEQARLVPYHLWDNREPGEMLVWLREH